MIPEFNDDGLLPPGLHLATLAEVAERFGSDSELRRVQIMTISKEKQIELTRDKLILLEQTLDEAMRATTGTPRTRELIVRSLKGLINQLKEEIARHEAHAVAPRRS